MYKFSPIPSSYNRFFTRSIYFAVLPSALAWIREYTGLQTTYGAARARGDMGGSNLFAGLENSHCESLIMRVSDCEAKNRNKNNSPRREAVSRVKPQWNRSLGCYEKDIINGEYSPFVRTTWNNHGDYPSAQKPNGGLRGSKATRN